MKTNFTRALLTLGISLIALSPAMAAYDKPYVGETKIYVADANDTLVHIARNFGMGYVEMRAANPHIDPWVPGQGSELVLPSRHLLPKADHEGIVINLPEMRLYAFVNGDKAPTTFPLGIGREGLETPIGQTKVVRKKDGPTWRPTARMRREDPTLEAVVPAGPENPLGTHALYLGWPTYALHGTNKPYGIGRRISSGCIRLYPENITQLYEMIPVGTKVTVVNQPIKLAWIDDVLYMESHPDMDQAIQMEETGQVYSAKMSDNDMKLIIEAAGEFQDRLHWATIRNEVRNRSGYPVMIARKPDADVPDGEYTIIQGSEIDKKVELIQADAKDALEEVYEGEETDDNQEETPPKRKMTLNP